MRIPAGAASGAAAEVTGNRLPPPWMPTVGASEETVDYGLAHSLSSQSWEEAEDSWRNTEVKFSMLGHFDCTILLLKVP